MPSGFHTLATAYDKVLSCTAESTANDVFALFLTHESSYNLRGLDIEQLNLVVGHIDQHVSGILADADAGQLNFQFEVVLLLSSPVIVYMYSLLRRDGDQSLSVR